MPPVPVPTGYPFRLADRDLDVALAEMMNPASWPGFDNFGALLPELKLALLAAGLQERQRREMAVSGQRALRVAYAALVVSAATLVVSVVIALST
jgi:hypothetical protein